jgi:hypothetical protein
MYDSEMLIVRLTARITTIPGNDLGTNEQYY